MSRPATPSDGTATTMKYATADGMAGGDLNHLLLRLVKSPGSRHDAAILAGIRISQHDFLHASALRQQLLVNIVLQQRVQHAIDMLEVIDSFE